MGQIYAYYKCCAITDSFATGNVYGGSHLDEDRWFGGGNSPCANKRELCYW